jgi:8-oxo-dGTP pyrophosphatase MutT (NUDIX family)
MQPTLDHWGNIMMTLSAKGIVRDGDNIWLRKNERGDWELPGGRVAQNEQPEDTVIREIREELGLETKNVHLMDMYVWHKDFGTNPYIGIVTYLCEGVVRVGDFEYIGEAGEAEFRQHEIAEALTLSNLPEVYKRALRKLL